MSRPQPINVAPRDEVVRAAVAAFVGPIVDAEPTVFAEIVSDIVAIDILFYPPSEESTCWMLVTAGMADAPTNGPDGARYTELTIALPKHWPVGPEAFAEESNYWPVKLLRRLARYPHEVGFALGPGHLIAFGDPAEPLDPTGQFNAVLIGVPLLLGDEALQPLQLVDGRSVRLLTVVPLRPSEYALAREQGMDALYERMNELADRDPYNELTEFLDVDRPSVA